MNYRELVQAAIDVGLKKSAVEKACGMHPGKLSEVSGGRNSISQKLIQQTIFGLEQMVESLNDILDQLRELDANQFGQYSVYELTFPNGKKYYGISVNPEGRWANGKGYKNQVVGRAIEKYGWDNVEKRIIASGLLKENAALIESTLINTVGTNMPSCGYNII